MSLDFPLVAMIVALLKQKATPERLLPPTPDMTLRELRSALCRYCCKSPGSLGANFSAVKKLHRRPLIRALNRVTEIVSEFIVRRRCPPHLYTKIACTAKRNFDDDCKRTFATKSAISGPSALQQTAYLLGGLLNLHNPRHADSED